MKRNLTILLVLISFLCSCTTVLATDSVIAERNIIISNLVKIINVERKLYNLPELTLVNVPIAQVNSDWLAEIYELAYKSYKLKLSEMGLPKTGQGNVNVDEYNAMLKAFLLKKKTNPPSLELKQESDLLMEIYRNLQSSTDGDYSPLYHQETRIVKKSAHRWSERNASIAMATITNCYEVREIVNFSNVDDTNTAQAIFDNFKSSPLHYDAMIETTASQVAIGITATSIGSWQAVLLILSVE